MEELNGILFYLLGVNVITFIIMGMDKQKARKEKYRIPERTFWLLAIVGGALGAIIGMQRYRHKTKHRAFMWGMPILFLVNVASVLYLLYAN
ncbi:DUF1294 domain-containing protein [Oceanobacillus kapialis]|uniref:DUF1294 domain-containing protein n=1 Tax=Oceanobacillus kapialis TaxID=481353 RepID=A0ABW5PXS3_9BACI